MAEPLHQDLVIGTNGYIGLGYEGSISSAFPPSSQSPYDRSNLRKDFYAYDPSTDSWSRKSDFGGPPRYGAVGFSIGNKGYFATGMSPMYNPLARIIEISGNMIHLQIPGLKIIPFLETPVNLP